MDGLSLYRILDPSGTGPWDARILNSRVKAKTAQGENVPWAVSDQGDPLTFSSCVDPVPVQTVFGIGTGGVQFYRFDVTGLVREWVDRPGTNMGITFDSTIISDRAGNPDLRPYLEVSYESGTTQPPSQVTGVQAFFHHGQTFITWHENSYSGQFYDAAYRIYCHTEPITADTLGAARLVGERHQGSSFNQNRSYRSKEPHTYKIREQDPELPFDTGLFVHTPEKAAEVYYAVTYVGEGYENRIDFSSGNALSTPITEQPEFPGAILQHAWDSNGDTIQEFVHFADGSMSYNKGMDLISC